MGLSNDVVEEEATVGCSAKQNEDAESLQLAIVTEEEDEATSMLSSLSPSNPKESSSHDKLSSVLTMGRIGSILLAGMDLTDSGCLEEEE
jgi:hypothetical protein